MQKVFLRLQRRFWLKQDFFRKGLNFCDSCKWKWTKAFVPYVKTALFMFGWTFFGEKFFWKIEKMRAYSDEEALSINRWKFWGKTKILEKRSIIKSRIKDCEWKFQGYLAKKLNWFVIIALYLSTRHFWWKTSYGLFSATVFAAFEFKFLDFWSRPIGFAFKTALSVWIWNVRGKTKNLPFFFLFSDFEQKVSEFRQKNFGKVFKHAFLVPRYHFWENLFV